MSEGQPSVVLMLAPEHLLDLYARRPRWCAGGCGGARGGDRGVTVEIPAGIGMGKVGGKGPLSPTFRYRMGRQTSNTCDQSKTGKKFEDIFEICLQMAFINCRSQTNFARGN